MENQISVLDIKLEEAPFYIREGVMGCDDVRGRGDVALLGKIQNVYVVCDGNGLIKSVLAYFPDDIKAIDMAPDYNLAVKYYVPQHLVAYHNIQGEIISASEFMRMYPEVFVQLHKGLKHAHFRTERWPLFRQFESDQYRTVLAGDCLVKRYALDEEDSKGFEVIRVTESDGSLGNCTFERKSIQFVNSGTLAEPFTDDVFSSNVFQLFEQGYDSLSIEAYLDILGATEQYRRDLVEAEMRLVERIEKNLSNKIK